MTRQVRGPSEQLVADDVIVEEPLAIHLDGTLVATTMRTPGDDVELAVGFCFTEGLLGDVEGSAIRVDLMGLAATVEPDLVNVDTGGAAPPPSPRLGTTSSSCGLCGNEAIEALTKRLDVLGDYEPWPLDLLLGLPEIARSHQPLFDRTGAVHVAVAFDRSGAVVSAREDIGRHNAVDKVIGRLLLDGALPATDRVLFVSSRASFEMVQKAWAAGFTALVAVSGPSSLAVATARQAGLSLVGFVRDGRANVYSPEAR